MGFINSVFLLVCVGDLLYLYFAGGWHDPNALIEITEILLLGILGILGICGMVYFNSLSKKQALSSGIK